MKLSFVIFETTQACNLDCRYCYNVWKTDKHETRCTSSYKQATQTLKQLFKVAEVQQVTMSGGEPFLAERFLETVLFCRMAGKVVNVISNGNTAPHDDLTELNKIGVTLFQMPFHSPTGASHDKMTGKDGSWEKSRRSIAHLRSIGAPVAAVVVLTSVNAGEVTGTFAALAEMGVDQVLFNRFNVGGRGIKESHWLSPDRETLRRAFRDADAAARRHGMKVSSGVCTPRCLIDPDKHPHLRFAFCEPDISRRPMTMDLRGNIRFCNHSPVILGNVFDGDLEERLSTGQALAWRKTVPEPCQACKVFDRCFGGCRAAGEQLGTGLTQVDPVIVGAARPM